jgi:hypothetical protein
MATLNLGRIKPVFRGAYNNSTAYVVDDIVTSGGSSYICIQASTGNAVSNATYWTLMAEGGDVASTLTTQGDILYRDGSGLQRLGAGTNGQALITGGAGANPSWGTISSGNYSVHAFDTYNYGTSVNTTGATKHYVDIAGGNTVSFTPTSTSDYVLFDGYVNTYTGPINSGGNISLMLSSNSSITSSDTKLGYSGTHVNYTGGTNDMYRKMHINYLYPCTSLTANTTYYVEIYGATHNNNINFNEQISGVASDGAHRLQLIHFKYNS